MLSYRHAFHAGNFADVLKHTALVHCLEYLVQKETPLRYIDTHAGIGSYNLATAEANKTQEYQQGIGLLWQRPHLPAGLAHWHHWVQTFNGGQNLNAYPGSPWFAQQILRPGDRLELCELHPRDIELLRRQMAGDRRVSCHFEDGYKQAQALMPPIERRGLVLIDPSYEVKTEYAQVVSEVKSLYRRFATGVYLIWYPCIEARFVQQLVRGLKGSGIKRINQIEWGLGPGPGMRATGLLTINAPWTLTPCLEESLAFALPILAPSGEGYVRAEVLVGE
ncbi:MAG: hypothetical protein RL497_716 [Pseudomonadota bacterium]|jgi:23S rRNA (adenine2030-N6)-methyltransferase